MPCVSQSRSREQFKKPKREPKPGRPESNRYRWPYRASQRTIQINKMLLDNITVERMAYYLNVSDACVITEIQKWGLPQRENKDGNVAWNEGEAPQRANRSHTMPCRWLHAIRGCEDTRHAVFNLGAPYRTLRYRIQTQIYTKMIVWAAAWHRDKLGDYQQKLGNKPPTATR